MLKLPMHYLDNVNIFPRFGIFTADKLTAFLYRFPESLNIFCSIAQESTHGEFMYDIKIIRLDNILQIL